MANAREGTPVDSGTPRPGETIPSLNDDSAAVAEDRFAAQEASQSANMGASNVLMSETLVLKELSLAPRIMVNAGVVAGSFLMFLCGMIFLLN